MIEVAEWTRRYRSELYRWPSEPNFVLTAAFLLRSGNEPYDVNPSSFAVLLDGQMVGRFTYRAVDATSAYVGLAINPLYRGRGLAAQSINKSCDRLAVMGFRSVSCSVAQANVPSYRAFIRAGFSPAVYEFRALPYDYDVSLLAGCEIGSYRLDPIPAMLYVSMSAVLYTEVAQR